MAEGQPKRRRWNSDRYPKMVTVRVTTDEHSEIVRLAGHARLSTSRLLVSALLDRRLPTLKDSPPPSAETREELLLLLFQLRKVGVNLNQLAYRTNRATLLGRFPPPRRKVDEVAAAVEGLVRVIRNKL